MGIEPTTTTLATLCSTTELHPQVGPRQRTCGTGGPFLVKVYLYMIAVQGKIFLEKHLIPKQKPYFQFNRYNHIPLSENIRSIGHNYKFPLLKDSTRVSTLHPGHWFLKIDCHNSAGSIVIHYCEAINHAPTCSFRRSFTYICQLLRTSQSRSNG